MSALIDINIYQKREAKTKEKAKENLEQSKVKNDDFEDNEVDEASSNTLINIKRPISCNYSTSIEASFSYLTASKGQHFETLVINQTNKKVWLASNNCEGNFWQGFISTAVNFESVNENQFLNHFDFKEGPISHLLLLPSVDKENLIACFDSGAFIVLDTNVKILAKLQSNTSTFTDARLSPSKKKCATSNKDQSITIYDLTSMTMERQINQAHYLALMGMDFQHNQENCFMTIGKDRLVLSWDLRLDHPASKYTRLNTIPTAIKWSHHSDNLFTVGTKDGDLILFDNRLLSKELVNVNYLSKRVYKLKHVLNQSHLAICYDCNQFQIIEENALLTKYLSNPLLSTNHYIRDCFEINSKVCTLGLNSNQIIQHSF